MQKSTAVREQSLSHVGWILASIVKHLQTAHRDKLCSPFCSKRPAFSCARPGEIGNKLNLPRLMLNASPSILFSETRRYSFRTSLGRVLQLDRGFTLLGLGDADAGQSANCILANTTNFGSNLNVPAV